MRYDYDKNYIKENLTTDQIEELLVEWGGEPTHYRDAIVSRTICHNHCGCGSHKLYYYPNTTLFKCYTDCGGEAFDIFELARKVLSREQPKAREDSDWNLPEAIDFVARRFNFAANAIVDESNIEISEDLTLFEKYDRIKDININNQIVELKEYEADFLKYLPHPRLDIWIKEGIKQEVMDEAGICFDPKNYGIVIPHYDINNRLIGIRERTLALDQAEKYGKYTPARIGRKMYNHPLSFNLYNLNKSKDNIRRMKKALVFEGEKSSLKYASYFGTENDISVAICGSSFINYQAWLLINQGAEEIVICLDKQFKQPGDKEFEKLVKNLKSIHNKYGRFVTLSFIFDKDNLLGYKESPVDRDKETFIELYKRRVNLYK